MFFFQILKKEKKKRESQRSNSSEWLTQIPNSIPFHVLFKYLLCADFVLGTKRLTLHGALVASLWHTCRSKHAEPSLLPVGQEPLALPQQPSIQC